MAEVIKFSEEERNKTLATPEANQFLQDGVINPNSPEWQELPPEKQKEILEEMSAKLGTSKAALLQLRGELDAQDLEEEGDSTSETKESSNNPNYKTGPLKEQVSHGNSFEEISDNMTTEQMGLIVKRNINLMQTKVREQWIKHFDDALLGSGVGFVFPEFEHLGRAIQPSTKVTSVDNADNILAFGQTSAAEQIDALVAQNTPESKAILKAMNESVKNEDGALFLWIGLYLATKTVGPVLTATLKGIIKFMSIKGKGGVQLLALGAELYEKLDRKMKGVDPANKTLWDSVKDRIRGEKLAGARSSELDTEQKNLRESQIKGTQNVVRKYLFEKYGNGMSEEAFSKAVDSPSGSSARNIVDARRAESEIMQKLSRHLPIEFSADVTDKYEIDQRMRAMALDMELSAWKKLRTGLYRFFFEKGGITNLVFQNKAVNLSERIGAGSYSGGTYADALRGSLDTVPVDIGDGQKIDVSRIDEDRVKELIKHIDADVALAAQKAEMNALAEVRRLEAEISTLKADGTPDSEQGVDEKIRQLEEAKMRYNEYKGLHDAVQSARTERTDADNDVTTKEKALETAKENHLEAKDRVRLYSEYYRIDGENNEATDATQKAEKQLNAGKQRVADAIRSLEGKVQGKITFTAFTGIVTDPDFLQQARSHIESIQSDIATYNSSAMEKIDTGDGAVKVIQSAEGYRDIFDDMTSKQSKKGAELKGKISELTAAGIWDPGTESISKTLSELQQEEKTAQQEEKTAQKNLTDAQEKQKKVQAGTDKAKKAVAGHPSQSGVYKGTQRQADGTVTSRDIKTQAEIDAELQKTKDMKDKLDAKKKAEEARIKAEAARATAAQKAGYTGDIKPKADGTHSTESQSFFDKMTQQQADTMTTYTDYVARAADKGYTMEVKDGKATLTDSAGKKFEFDMRNPAQRAEFFKKIK